jgi:hypothetical protein
MSVGTAGTSFILLDKYALRFFSSGLIFVEIGRHQEDQEHQESMYNQIKRLI